MKNIFPLLFSCILFSFNAKSHAQVGSPAPDFTVTDTHGETHTLYDYLENGKTVVLDFYYTTCGPCIFYSPQVNLAYEKYGCNSADVVFIGIDYDDTNAEVIAYDEEYEIEYPSVSGLEGGGNEVVNLYNIFGFPTFYVIDSTKTIVQEIDPPTLVVFDFRFNELGIVPAECDLTNDITTDNNESFVLFPNPADGDKIYVQVPDTFEESISFEIFNMAGMLIKKGIIDSSNKLFNEINIGNLTSGNYVLNLKSKNGELFSEKFMKK